MAKTASAAKRRLNTLTRMQMVVALFTHATWERDRSFIENEDRLAERALASMLGEEGVRLLKRIPKGWLHSYYGINVNAGGYRVPLNFYDLKESEERIQRRFTEEWPDVNAHRISGVVRERAIPQLIQNRDDGLEDEELVAEIRAHVEARKAWIEERVTLHHEICQVVSSFRYVEDALKAIPELAKLRPSLLKPEEPKPNALVPTVERLLCRIAHVRGEEREGCRGGQRVADLEKEAA